MKQYPWPWYLSFLFINCTTTKHSLKVRIWKLRSCSPTGLKGKDFCTTSIQNLSFMLSKKRFFMGCGIFFQIGIPILRTRCGQSTRSCETVNCLLDVLHPDMHLEREFCTKESPSFAFFLDAWNARDCSHVRRKQSAKSTWSRARDENTGLPPAAKRPPHIHVI